MRRLSLILFSVLIALPAMAQQRKMKLDSLGLPPYPGVTNVGHISLPLKDILKPKPGEHPTGPALTDLAIQTYRTPLTTSVDSICAFYLKYAQQLGWRLLDDIPDGVLNRSLVFWSPLAPGYLTVEVLPGPDNTRQIDLTRLLGDVDPMRPGEVVKLTGKRIREQHVEITYMGQFQNIKTGKVARQTLTAVEERSESGLPATAALRIAPKDETYLAVIKVKDSTKHMVSADAYTTNNTLVAHGESPTPTGSLTMLGRVRATQGLALRVVVMGWQVLPATPIAPKPAPQPVKKASTAKFASTAKPGSATRKPAQPVKPAPTAVPAPFQPGAAGSGTPAPLPVAPSLPPPTPVALTEWYGLRPPLTAILEARRGPSTTKTDSVVIEKDVELGSTCDERKTQTVPWRIDTTDQFTFSPDLFGISLQRGQVGTKTGTQTVEFPLRSGTSNTYTVTQAKATTTTEVSIGYAFNGQWVSLPGKRENPTKTTYVVTNATQPVITRKSTGVCPAK
ncbi:MAG TPA: hypothetical protein VGM51_03660 [Armatimonadota bacterium]